MIFLEKDLLLSRRSGSSFTEQVIRPQTASLLAFDENKIPVVIPSSSVRVESASYALSASYASNGGGGPSPSLVLVQNGSGLTLSKGQVVSVIGSNLNSQIVVDLAVSKIHTPGSTITSDILGVVNDSIPAGFTGYVLTSGYLTGLNTATGFSLGDELYVSPSVSGSYTSIRPHAPRDVVKVGYITGVNNTTGSIFVDVKQPTTIDEISNISSSASPADGAFLVYNAADGIWEDKSSGLVLSGSLSASNADVGSLMAGTAVVNDIITTTNAQVNNDLTVENDIIVGRDVIVERQLVASGSSAPFRVVSSVDGTNVFYVTGSRVGINNKDDPQFNLEVNGSFAASTKSFVIDHQEDQTKRLVHATLEGPEHAVFVRGRSESLSIELPDYWTWLIDEATITVHLTAIGAPDTYYVEKIDGNKIYIGVDRKANFLNRLFNKGTVNFYYMINAERKDVDKLKILIDRSE